MWWEVGKVLQRARLDKHWTLRDVERHGGPTYKTVQAIEDGKAGNVQNLKKTADALGLNIVDVLYSVLSKREKPLSPEAAFVVRRFEETTVGGRTALVATAAAVPTETPAAPMPTPTDAETPVTPGRSRAVPRAATRRSEK
jgi:transcriptional regulator with XRE-family HTH domain